MEFLGYFLALLIGVTLGLIGGGGSILAVPVLVYIMGIDPVVATGYSLFIVGFSALVGAYDYYRKGLIAINTGIVFAIPALVAVFLTRKYLIPALPDTILSIGSYEMSKGTFLMVFFALLMLAAAFSMFRQKKKEVDTVPKKLNIPLVAIEGFVTGVITGLVGAGGGFIIIPALVLLAGLSMKVAVGTSLMIIAIKSLIGFTGDVTNIEIDWVFLGVFTGISLLGIFMGSALARKIDGNKLKRGFAFFLVILAIVMLVGELA
jgi:hypothetical protein